MSQAGAQDVAAQAHDCAGKLFGAVGGATVLGGVQIGHDLGLYTTLAKRGPATPKQLAEAHPGGVNERFLREWLQGQACAGFVSVNLEAGSFFLNEGQKMVLAAESPAFYAGAAGPVLATIAEAVEPTKRAFLSGRGLTYDAHGPVCAHAISQFLASWNRHQLVPSVLKVEKLAHALKHGKRLLEFGCGAGVGLTALATAFPNLECTGLDISSHALKLAADRVDHLNLKGRVHLVNGKDTPLPNEPTYDFVLVNDVLHDTTRPDKILAALRRCIKPDGVMLVADINGAPTFEGNFKNNPMAAMFYHISVFICLSSAVSEPDGLGLGTLGLPEPVARKMFNDAGWAKCTMADFGDTKNPINNYYVVEP